MRLFSTALRGALLFLALTSPAAAALPDSLADRVDSSIPPEGSYGMFSEPVEVLAREGLPVLRSRLHDPKYQGHQSSICSAIGLIGAPEGFPILRAFVWDSGVERDSLLGTPRACTPELVAQSAIGLIAKNSTDALEYLQKSTNPAYWDSLPWYCSDGGNTRMALVDMSIVALTYTERLEARAFLVRLSQTGKSEMIRSKARQAVTTFDEIRKVGFEEYKRRNRGF